MNRAVVLRAAVPGSLLPTLCGVAVRSSVFRNRNIAHAPTEIKEHRNEAVDRSPTFVLEELCAALRHAVGFWRCPLGGGSPGI
jgi:hypothetical protein